MKYLRVVLSFSFLCCLVGIRAQTIEAATCSDAYQKNVDSIYTTHTIESGQTEYWISFTAASSRINFNTSLNSNAPIIDKVQLFSGSCSGLQLLEVDSLFSIGQSIEFQSNLSIGQQYLILIQVNSIDNGTLDACLTVKEFHEGPLVIVNSNGDTTYCTFEIPYHSFRCKDLTICSGDTLCFSATDTLGIFTTMGVFIHEVYGQIGEINYNSDSSEACVVFPYSGNQTIIVKPFILDNFNSLGFSANFPFDNQINAQGDSIGDYINYLNVNVIDSVPPGINNSSDGVLCLGSTYTLNAYPGSVIGTVSVNDTLSYAVNSTSWSFEFLTSGEYIITYTEEGLCHPATYTDTILVFDQPIVLVDSNACNQYNFHFIACENYDQILFNVDGENIMSFNDVADTTWSYDFSIIMQPAIFSISGVQVTFQEPQTFSETTVFYVHTVFPNGPQTISINATSFLCEMGEDSIFISSPSNLTGISWVTIPSMAFSGQGTNSIQPTDWPEFGEDIIVQVTGNDDTGCPFLGQDTVKACCEITEINTEFFEQTYTLTGALSMANQLPSGYYNGPSSQIVIDLPSAPSLSNQTSTLYSTATTYSEFLVAHPNLFTSSNVMQTSEWVFFNNDFIVDKDLTILNCQFIRFAPGARILLNTGVTLHVQSTTLAPKCQEMWGGIVVSDSTQQVYIDSASIIGATTGLLSDSGGFCQVKNSRFIDNYVGVQFQNNFEYQSISTITGTYFGDVQGQNLLIPYTNESTPYAGVMLKDIKSIVIGTSANANGNLFHNQIFGIHASHSTIYSFKNNFYNIRKTGPVGTYSNIDRYNAIFAENPPPSINEPFNKSLFVGGSTDTRNNFLYCAYGVVSNNGMHLDARNNYMKNVIIRGISAENNTKRTITILNNELIAVTTMNPFLFGIYVKDFGNSILKVNFNVLNYNSSTSSNRFRIGIYVSSTTQTAPNTALIQNNTIHNSLRGIWMINIKNGKLLNNSVLFHLSNAAVNYYANGFLQLRGILVQNSINSEVSQNTIHRTIGFVNGVDNKFLQGIRVENSPNIKIWENQMINVPVGFYALGNSYGSRIQCNLMDLTRNGFYLEGATLSDQGAQAILNGSPGFEPYNRWYNTLEEHTKGTCTMTTYYHSYPSYLSSSPFLATDNNSQWQDSVINSINPKNSCSQAKDTIPFYTPEQIRQRELEDIVTNSINYDSLDYEQKHYLNIACYSRLKSDSTLVYMNEWEDSLYVNYIVEQEELNNPNKILFDCQKAMVDQDYELAMLKNSLLPNEYPVYYTNKQVQELWLQRKLDSIDLSGMDTSFLMDIACLDPIVFGSGVYQARAILDWDGECEYSGKSTTSVNTNFENQDNQIQLYPNPSSGIVNIEGVEKLDKLVISNINGVVLHNITGESQFEINLNESPGLYIFTLYLNDGTVENHKIIID
jgi:hypothetical protein